MISALKRLTKRQDDTKTSSFPSGVAAIGPAMQKKFAKGVHYNMKIVIKGDRNTGKTCLLQRLQGKRFSDAYIPTQAIQAASINWNYRGCEDIVKVDVWDIVDKGQKRSQQEGLKIANDPTQEMTDDLAADADNIDVYKGTHGVIMLLDITKPWTWSYIERELPKVPFHIPVLVLANFRDMGEHRLVDVENMKAYAEHLERPCGSAEVNFAEASMKDGFGLRYLYTFLNIPFLILQRETLLRQLEANALEIENIREELLWNLETEEQNYSLFIGSLHSRKTKTSGAVSPSSEVDETASEALPNIASDGMQKNADPVPETAVTHLPTASSRQSVVKSANMPAQERNYKAKVEKSASHHLDKADGPDSATKPGDINEFSPEDELDPSFLSDSKQKRFWNKFGSKKPPESNVISDSDEESDAEGANPLVADYQDLSSDEEKPTSQTYKAKETKKSENKNEVYEEVTDESEEEETNPLVENPVNELSDEENVTEVKNNTKSTEGNDERLMSNRTQNDEESGKNQEVKDVDADSSDEESRHGNHYEVAVDFDLEEPGLDDWLDRGHKTEATEKYCSIASADKDKPRHTSFTIDADELDMFVSEQLRKTSISTEVSEKEEIKKPKKKKEKKQGEEGEKRKKKKTTKTIKEGDEKEHTKKKTKGKTNKKKKSPQTATEDEDYELL